MSVTAAKQKWTARDMAYVAIFAVTIAICSWISIPTTVPFTLQTFAVFLAVGVLGGRRGTFAVLVYILLGAVGLPVFAGFSGGLGALLGTTGGYIIGYIPLALIEGILIEVFKDKKWTYPIWMIVGTIVLYLLGSIHFFFVNNQATTFFHILKVCVFPFIPIDLAKIVIATLLSIKLRPIVMRNLY